MTTKPPLTDADYAAVRRSVMTKIAAQESRRTWLVRGMQLAFAARISARSIVGVAVVSSARIITASAVIVPF